MRVPALVLALAVGLVVAADKPTRGDGKKGPKGLEGTWEIVAATEDGRPDDVHKGQKVIFKGKNVTLHAGQGDQKATFRIDPKTKAMDITPTGGDHDGQTFKGIYELKKGRLKICLAPPGQDRPKKFASEEGSGVILAVLERPKPD